jgi:hypothetical protein
MIYILSYLLSFAYQTHDRINDYPIYIISCLYPALYHIMLLSYPDHQTGLQNKFLPDTINYKMIHQTLCDLRKTEYNVII